MAEKPGRNDPCPCGSGKKYKSCCFVKEQQQKVPLTGKKFKAKVISGGGMYKHEVEPVEQKQAHAKPAVDYAALMERSFGGALHSYEEKPPIPSNPAEYLVSGDDTSKK